MMLNKGKHGSGRILSRPSVETMTTDQLTPRQKAVSGLVPGYFESRGCGFGVSRVTRRDDVAGSVGRFGWDGGLGTSWYSDPREAMVTILMTQRAWTSPVFRVSASISGPRPTRRSTTEALLAGGLAASAPRYTPGTLRRRCEWIAIGLSGGGLTQECGRRDSRASDFCR